MDDFRGKVVAVTGAASGLGAEIARAFARRGARLELCDVDSDRLCGICRELERAGAEVSMEVVDVSRAEQVGAWSEHVLERSGAVDVLVNNAGVTCAGRFEALTLDDWEWIAGIDFWGVIYGCHFFYPRMKERGRGHIVNISSAAAHAPLPLMSAYGTLKAAVLAFSQSLRGEGAAYGIGVSVVCPGAMNTNIADSMRLISPAGRMSLDPKAMEGSRTVRFLRGSIGTPARVAEQVVRAVERDRGIVNAGIETKLLDLFWRVNRRLAVAGLRTSLRLIDRHL
ncbi:MAG: SDR family NAD(P)-dependent oxidoreductase [Actinomycetota bacterium]